MPRRHGLYQWTDEVTTAFPHLSKAQAAVLALWAFGIVLARSCALSAVALVLAPWLRRRVNTVRQRLREFYQEAGAKRGLQRQQLDVTTCLAPLLRWVLRGWSGRQLPLALDATSLGARFVVLAISAVYRGTAIPVGWKVLPANVKGAWEEHWRALLRQFQGAVPEGYTVIALTDRGLGAKWLFEDIRALGWHPLMRVKDAGSFRPAGWAHFRRLGSFAPQVGMRWGGRGTAFATKACQLEGTLLAYWGAGHAEAWLLLTDLAPAAGDASWYGWRSWIEQGSRTSSAGAGNGQPRGWRSRRAWSGCGWRWRWRRCGWCAWAGRRRARTGVARCRSCGCSPGVRRPRGRAYGGGGW
jgi:hypothetical protein